LGVFLLTLVGFSNGPLLNAAGRQYFFAFTQALAVCANAILGLLLIPKWGADGAAMAFVLPGIGTFFIHSRACQKQFDLGFPWVTIGKIALVTSLMGLVVLISLKISVPWLITVFILAPVTYGVTIYSLGIIKYKELEFLASAPKYSR
jgi:O-antigen/teichoic acid export membrane protein